MFRVPCAPAHCVRIEKATPLCRACEPPVANLELRLDFDCRRLSATPKSDLAIFFHSADSRCPLASFSAQRWAMLAACPMRAQPSILKIRIDVSLDSPPCDSSSGRRSVQCSARDSAPGLQDGGGWLADLLDMTETLADVFECSHSLFRCHS